MRHTLLVLTALTGLLAGCSAADQNAGLTLSPNGVVIPADQVDAADASSLTVQTEKDLQAGQVVISDEGDGLVRRITSVQTQSITQVGTQVVRKVYLNTEDASLEEAIASGNADLDFGTLQIGEASLVQSVPGVQAEAITGKITLKNVTFTPVQGVTITLNGSVTQSLDPTFRLQFANNKVRLFEAGIAGTLSSELKASVTTTGKATLSMATEQTLASYSLKRAFLVGAVPVVVVIEPRLVAGAGAGADKAITVNAGVAPSLSVNLGARYDGSTGQWSSLSNQPAFKASLNPSFSYSAPGGGQGQVYAKLVLDVKFYGVVGPSLEAKPFANLSISANTPTQASLAGGLSGTGALKAGFKVLGKGLDTQYALPTVSSSQTFTCSSSGCSAN